MNIDLMTLLIVFAGLLIRFGVPVLITGLIVVYLRRLDARWQAEAANAEPVSDPVHCWEIRDCSPQQRANCKVYSSGEVCWQVKRLPNGYLPADCLNCEVFQKAPLPVHI